MTSKKILWALLAMLGLVMVAQQLQAADGVDVVQAQNMSKQGALLQDVREASEYSAIHAPNAKLIPLGELGTRLREIESYKDKPIVVICRSGRRSAIAVSQLQEAGYKQASNVKGGMVAWQSSGLEIAKM